MSADFGDRPFTNQAQLFHDGAMSTQPQSSGKPRASLRGLIRFTSFFLLFMLLPGALSWHLGWLKPGAEVILVQNLQTWGPWMPVAFGVFKIITIILAVPAAPVTFVGGMLFGPYWGTLINIVSATLGACLCFGLSRWLGQGYFEAIRGDRLKTLDQLLATQGFRATVLLRLTPFLPFNVVNYSAGLTRVSFNHYFWGTLIGVCPGAAAYSWMGHGAHVASWSLVLLGAALLLLFWLGTWYWKPHVTQPVVTMASSPDTPTSESTPCPPVV